MKRAHDTFSRTQSAGWGTAEYGGAWTEGINVGGGLTSVTGSAGRMRIPGTAGGGIWERLAGLSNLGTVTRAVVSLSALPSGGMTMGSLGMGLLARSSGAIATPDGYQAVLNFGPDGALQVRVGRTVAGALTVLQEITKPAGTFAAGVQWVFEFECAGQTPTLLRARAYRYGTTPGIYQWDVQVQDSTGPQGVGSPMIRFSRSAIGSALTFDLDVDSYRIQDPYEYVRDNFSRDTAAGTLGAAEVGGAYEANLATPSGGAAYQCLAAGGGIARIAFGVNTTTTTFGMRLPSAALLLDCLASMRFRGTVGDATYPNATDWSITIWLRCSSGNPITSSPAGYAVMVTVQQNGGMTLRIGYQPTAGGSITFLSETLTYPAGAYGPTNSSWRLEAELWQTPGTASSTVRARLEPLWGGAVVAPGEGDDWLTLEDDTSASAGSGVQIRVLRGTPAVATNQLVDIEDLFVIGLPRPYVTAALLPVPPAASEDTFRFTRDDDPDTGIAGEMEPYQPTWTWGDGTAGGTGIGPIDHAYTEYGVYNAVYDVQTPWGWHRRYVRQVIAAQDSFPPGGPPRPIITIDGRDVCDLVYEASWNRGSTQWTDGIVGGQCTISLRGRQDWIDLGETIGIVMTDAAGGKPLWQGYVDQVSIHKDQWTAENRTQIIGYDVAGWLGRLHVAPGTVLDAHALPARLNQLTPATRVRYRSKWGSIPAGRWPTLKALKYKPDKLAAKTYLEMIRDACAASIVFAYVAGNGDVIHGPWDAPNWTVISTTPVIDLDGTLDCPSSVDWDRRNLAGAVNRWTVGSGDKIDRYKQTDIELYGEATYSVPENVMADESTFPYLPFWNHMSLPKRCPEVTVPVRDRTQMAIQVEPLDLARWETKGYSVMGVRHTVDRDTWTVTLSLDRSAWDTCGAGGGPT